MKKIKKRLTSLNVTKVTFPLAVVLLICSTIGGARAALTYYSEPYFSRVQMYSIGVTLTENGSDVSWRNYNGTEDGSRDEAVPGKLLSNLIPEGETLKIGASYTEELGVRNSGTINQYVRVSVHKYWMDEDGNKVQNVSPDLIDLHLVNTGSDWIVDEAASTPERTVLYYNKLLPAGVSTALFADSLTIDSMVASKVTQETSTQDGYTTITTTYDYDGLQFAVEAKVDAVQEHNAQDAVWSAWGKKVTISGGTLSLSQEGA